MGHPLGRLALLHPFPSALDALLVAILATMSGAAPLTAATLAIAMLGFQVSIGALNDLVDAPADARTMRPKPIPAGLVSPRVARVVVLTGGSAGLALSAVVSPAALVLGAAGYGCGVAYDLRLKRLGLGWVAFTAAFPLLLLYAWTGAGGGLPPGWPVMLPVAALAGPALHLANGLTDLDLDLASGGAGLAARLGRPRAVRWLIGLTAAVHLLAWMLLVAIGAPVAALGVAAVAAAVSAMGLVGSVRGTERSAAWGWSLQAIGIACLAIAWVVGAAS